MTAIKKATSQKLWNPKSFIIFSLFFSFVPAGIMSGLNYGRSGDEKKKWLVLVITILGFVAIISLSSIFSIDVSIIFLVINIGAGIILYLLQRKLYEQHIQSGGKKASYLLPLITGAIIFSIAGASILYTINIPRSSLAYAENHLFYTYNISQSEAKHLGDYLRDGGYFTSTSKIDVKIDKQKDLYILSLVAEGDYENNPNYLEPMKAISKEFSKNVFNNNKVRIDLCDDKFKVLKSISAD